MIDAARGMTIEIATVGVTTEIVIETATAIEDADRQMIDDVGLETKIDIKNEEDDLGMHTLFLLSE